MDILLFVKGNGTQVLPCDKRIKSFNTLLAVGYRPAPGPAKVDTPILSLLTTTMFPGPFALANGLFNGTILGATNTAKEPSAFCTAVPTNLIVDFKVLAYSKSTEVIFEMPVVGTVSHGTVLPNANLARRAIFA